MSKKVISLNAGSMSDEAVKDILEVSEEVTGQLEAKKELLQSILDIVEEKLNEAGTKVHLRLAEEGYDLLFSDMADYLEDPEELEDDEELYPAELFVGDDAEGNEYSIMVVFLQNTEDEESIDLNIGIFREGDGKSETLTEQGWLDSDVADQLD